MFSVTLQHKEFLHDGCTCGYHGTLIMLSLPHHPSSDLLDVGSEQIHWQGKPHLVSILVWERNAGPFLGKGSVFTLLPYGNLIRLVWLAGLVLPVQIRWRNGSIPPLYLQGWFF